MEFIKLKSGLLVGLMMSSILIGCGGGDSAPATTQGNQTTGVVTGFGSIYVNGIHFNTSNTSVTIDGSPATVTDLDVGMVVTVSGTTNPASSTGTASSVNFDDDLEGIVISNSIPAGQDTGVMNIMGQTVNVESNTVFQSDVVSIASVDAIAAGNIVEVSGYASGNGEIFATRLEVKAVDLATYLSAHPGGVEVKGIVSSLDAPNFLFNIGSLVVDYSAADTSDLNSGLANGMRVEVKSVAGLNANNHLVASKVEPHTQTSTGSAGDEIEIKGAVTQAVANNQFMLIDKTIIINANTVYEGLTVTDIAVGMMLEVEGQLDSNGDIVAQKVEREDSADQEIAGNVTAKNATGTNTGTLTVGTTVVNVTNSTMMIDKRDNGVQPVDQFNLSFIEVGDYLEVDGYTDGNGDFIATKIERDDQP